MIRFAGTSDGSPIPLHLRRRRFPPMYAFYLKNNELIIVVYEALATLSTYNDVSSVWVYSDIPRARKSIMSIWFSVDLVPDQIELKRNIEGDGII